IDPAAVQNAARVLRNNARVLLLLADDGVQPRGQDLAWRIAAKTGAGLMADYVNGHLARGRGRLQIEKVPYVMDVAIKAL
ncbi:hypothetical protein ABTM94_19995, partial [Acinetobacter baumannii]